MLKRFWQSIPFLILFLPAVHAAPSCERAAVSALSAAGDEQTSAFGRWGAVIQDPEAPVAERIKALIERGETYRALGRYPDAERDLAEAKALASASGLDALAVAALQAQGQTAAQQQRTLEAEELLQSALEQARQLNSPILIASSAHALGNLRWGQGRSAEAERLYREALTAAERTEDLALSAAVRIALARQSPNTAQAMRELKGAEALIERLPHPAEQADLGLRLAEVARRLGREGQAMAKTALSIAAERAERSGRLRTQSQALGVSSELLEAEGRLAEARRLSERAIAAAPLNAYDLRYQWEWRLGRLLRAQGERKRAIAAYRRAVDHLQRIRSDIPIEYAEGRSSFRETLSPLYLGLADLLFQEAPGVAQETERQALLREGRETVEQLKLDELRDYFRDACILPLRKEIETLAPRTAVLYPVILDDRLELLVSTGRRLDQATVPVGREQVALTAEILALKLRYDQPAEAESRQLYDWLIAPIADLLQAQAIETLVFVPDGPLRAVPLAALRSPEGYLIERYAVAIVPGLKLLQPESFKQGEVRVLLAGLSKPGPVVDELPGWWVDALIEQYRRRGATAETGERRGISVRVRGASERQRGSGPSRAPTHEKIAALSLPGVAEEIDQLAQRVAGRALRDQDFVLNRFTSEVSGQPYRVVHIASHGLFQGPPEENFILTYDRKLDMKILASLLKPKELAAEPIELLVLSACQTAEGDDRTPLGLSGIAIQSGARSALGSLWPVGDATTQRLMGIFYEQLKQPGMTRVRALQIAQRSLLADPKTARPSDWAAFILVGNWM
ncbi:CHAT domain-containing protein [Caldichromatium japonicum]|uniref:CHAT domain-containing protein n=1 Tax=Caldichromatium japonicum TaxID=2699430 RepID=A0A6G7VEC6_9GAMM|nr:CHAT domain-containing protein [Caldichromatium japonicum]QIK38324.1 CHAT domain-containing protein [Caldichromatium japonicum]